MICAAENETMTDDETAEAIIDLSDALMTLLAGRPNVVVGDACLRVIAEVLVDEYAPGPVPPDSFDKVAALLRGHVGNASHFGLDSH
jgi:hypothetical protein